MNILLTTHTFLPDNAGGAEHQIKYLAEGLAESGHDIVLLGPPGGRNAVPEGIVYRDADFSGAANKLLTAKRIRDTVRQHDIDLVHSHFIYPAGVLATIALKGVDTPHIITSHGADLLPSGFRQDWKKEALISWALEHCDRHIVISRRLEDYSKNLGTPEKRLLRIPNMLPKISPPAPAKLSAIRQNAGLPEQYVLYMGRLSPEKGVKHLLRAFSNIYDETDAHLVIAGDGPDRTELEQESEELDIRSRTHFLGFVSGETKWAVLSGCQIFCLPSIHEALGSVLLEAMFFEKPVVASDTGGIPDLITSDEGVLVPPANPDALSKALIELLKNQETASQLGQNGRNKVEQFSQKRIVQKHIALYKTMI